jgi:hypothetical protein
VTFGTGTRASTVGNVERERSEESDLAEARRQLEYDREHHAIRSRIAEHEARIKDIERDLKGELREHDRD